MTASSGYTISRNTQNGLPETVSGRGMTISRTFNGYGELDGQTVTVGSQPAVQWSITRDDTGRIITKTETAGGETHNYEYSYDAIGRLLSVIRDGSLVEEYAYDLSGTRITETNTLRGIASRSMSYSDEDHLLSAGDAVYSYDLDGFLSTKTLSGQVTTYNYSTRGELQQVDRPDGRTVSYDHDPLGRRITKRIDGVVVAKYLWEGITKLLAVYDGSDNLVQRYEYADGRMPVAMTQSGSRYFLAYDQVGSLLVVTDASGNVVKRIDYDTFGNILNDTNSSLALPFGFAGGLHDRDTGLVRFGHRDYDPDTGRWTAKDPIRFAGGDTDLYGYVQNNPVNWIDPFGLDSNPTTQSMISIYGLHSMPMPHNDPITNWARNNLTQAPLNERVNTAQRLSNGLIDLSGINDWQSSLYTAGLIVGASDAALIGSVLYPELMVAAGTPQGQSILSNAYDFISSANPGTMPPKFSKIGLFGWYIGTKVEDSCAQ